MTYEDCFERYGSQRPTQFDGHICIDDEEVSREEWLLMPVSRTRDSQPIDNVNFDEFLKGLGGESDTVEVHRFGHWGPGWYEIIIVAPHDDEVLAKAYDMARSLQDYPILNEEALSEAEHEDAQESWDNWARRDVEMLLSSQIEMLLEDTYGDGDGDGFGTDPEDLADMIIDDFIREEGLPEYEMCNDGPHFDIEGIADKLFKQWEVGF